MGDLISREALIEVIRKSTYVTSMYFGKNDWHEWIDRDRVFAVINGAPAVDAKPVRHGKWINAGHDAFTQYRRCSSCARLLANAPAYDYCPGCGAKMDGDEK